MPLPDLVRRWQPGWGRCRTLPAATEVPGGLRVVLGLPGRHAEIFALDDQAVPALAERVAEAAEPTWLTVPTTRPGEVHIALENADLEPFPDAERLMTIELDDHPAHPVPNAYWAKTSEFRGVHRIDLTGHDGTVAASGLAAIVGTDAVMHDIRTDPAHRRRGLASAVMSALAVTATQLGATTALLVATTEGEHLYTRLGWEPVATMLTATAPMSALVRT
ncbi:GNAT family N-acetyltransferase [Amycolatopsis minnesotensis]|uniref:N-acetyltransferase domain-containing protein n=1 Tax=Amycolatopsis minnesotensis TaxID=337894 RepID=A0ABP5BZK3_9PSEU